MRCLVVLIARSGSSRLPGKVLKPVLGRPLLAVMLERLSRARVPDGIVVATTTKPADDAIVDIAKAAGVLTFRGDEDDWARRILGAAQAHGADIIVRVMADCPLIDPAIVDAVASLARIGHADYVATELEPVFPIGMGCDAVRTADLARVASERPDDGPEAVWSALCDTARGVRRIALPATNRDSRYRWTVDEQADLDVVTRIFETLYPANPAFGLRDLLDYAQAHPESVAANRQVVQQTGVHARDSAGGHAPRRDRAWIEREYNADKWPSVSQVVAELRGQGEASLSRLHHRSFDLIRKQPGAEFRKVFIDGEPVLLPSAFALGGIEALVAAYLRDLCAAENPAAVVELGAGTGRNLLSFWLRGGPRDIPYIAYEIASSGRDAARLLADTEPAMDLRTFPFDLNAPSFEDLPDGNGPIVVFTNHAIEQVPHLKEDVFRALVSLGRPVRAVHFEPVGWQIRSMRGEADGHGSSRAYADRHDYNRNFWPLLSRLGGEGVLTIEEVRPDFACINAENGTSIVRWRTP